MTGTLWLTSLVAQSMRANATTCAAPVRGRTPPGRTRTPPDASPPAADLLEGGRARRGRQRGEEQAPVGLREDPVVEDRDDAAVVLAPDEPAEALLERDG